MIEKATEAFWERLAALSFVEPDQTQRWRNLAAAPAANWLQLCQMIQNESPLTASHLQSLAQGVARPPVAIGSCLIMSNAFQTLGWESYEARHVKLQKNLRLLLVPGSEPSAAESRIVPQILDRVRELAGVHLAGIPQVIDVEQFGQGYVVTMTPTVGRRLSQYWSARTAKTTPSIDFDLAKQLVSLLRDLENGGQRVSRLDPLLLSVSEPNHGLAFDDLVSSEWLDDDFFPSDLPADEVAVVVDYRAKRAGYLGSRAATAGGMWWECAAALDFTADQMTTRWGDDTEALELGRQLRDAADGLTRVASGAEVDRASWLARWLSADGTVAGLSTNPGPAIAEPLPDSVTDTDDGSPSNSVAAVGELRGQITDKITVGDADLIGSAFTGGGVGGDDLERIVEPNQGPGQLSAMDRRAGKSSGTTAPGGIAARQAAKREQQRRQRVVTALAVAAPFPICLFIFLLAYFLWPAGEGLPDVSNQSGGSELPSADLPDSGLGLTPSAPSSQPVRTERPAERQAQSEFDPKTEGLATAGRATGHPEGGQDRPLEAIDQDELLADLVPVPQKDATLGDLAALSAGGDDPLQSLSDLATPLGATYERGNLADAAVKPDNATGGTSAAPDSSVMAPEPSDSAFAAKKDLTIAESAAAANSGSADGSLTGADAAVAGSKAASVVVLRGAVATEAPEEDGFLSFGAVLTAVDWLGAWQAAHGGAGADKLGPLYRMSVGRLNATTARHMQMGLTGPGVDRWDLQQAESLGGDDPQIVQAWELGVKANGSVTPIARLETTIDGHLELRFVAAAISAVPSDSQLQLELHDSRREMSHVLDLAKGQRPRMTGEVMEPAGAGMDGPVAVASGKALAGAPGGTGGEMPTELDGQTAEGRADDAKTDADAIANLTLDPRTGSVKAWGQELEGGRRENLTWHFQVAGRVYKPLDEENPIWQALKFRGKESPYISDDLLDAGSLVLTVATEEGRRLRVQARLHLLTPAGLRQLKKGTLAEASSEAATVVQGFKVQYQALKETRAKPGGGDQKQAELNRLEAVIKELERYQKVIDGLNADAEQIFEQGIAFGVTERLGEEDVWLLKSAGFQPPVTDE